MKNLIKNTKQFGSYKWSILASLSILLTLGVVSCDSIVDVTDPDIVTPESLNSEAGIQTLKAGSLGDLSVALSGSGAGHGGTVGLTVMSGLMSDEYIYSGTFPTRREADTRNLLNTNGTMDVIYSNIHRARTGAEATIDLAQGFGGVPEVESEMQSIVGYVYVIFAETFCGAVPFSKVPAGGGDIIYGEPLTQTQMFNAAINWFEQAASSSSGNSDLANLARVGKARALLGLGQIADAANEVASVPTDFVYNIEHSDNSTRQENGIYIMTTLRRQYSMANEKGGNKVGIPYRDIGFAGDPRVPYDGGTTNGQDDITLYYNQLKFTDENASVALASGIEARLIQAEAEADSGSGIGTHTILNELRDTIGLPTDLDFSALSGDALMLAHMEERALWLYSTGKRHGDLRRLVDVYGMQASDVFPWGDYFKGGSYDSNLTFPIPQSEANNPNYVECL